MNNRYILDKKTVPLNFFSLFLNNPHTTEERLWGAR